MACRSSALSHGGHPCSASHISYQMGCHDVTPLSGSPGIRQLPIPCVFSAAIGGALAACTALWLTHPHHPSQLWSTSAHTQRPVLQRWITSQRHTGASLLASRFQTPSGTLLAHARDNVIDGLPHDSLVSSSSSSNTGNASSLAAFAIATAVAMASVWRYIKPKRATEPDTPLGTTAAGLLLSCTLAASPAQAAPQFPEALNPPALSAAIEGWVDRATDLAKSASSSLPSLPTVPSIPDLPSMPNLPALPTLPTAPTLPSLSFPDLPTSQLPDLSLTSLEQTVSSISQQLQQQLPPGMNMEDWLKSVDFDTLWKLLSLQEKLDQLSEVLKTDPQQAAVALQEIGGQLSSLVPNASRSGPMPSFLQPAVDRPVLWSVSWALLASLLIAAATPAEEEYGDDSIPSRYDLKRLRAYFSRRPYERARRTFEILSKFGRWVLKYYLDEFTDQVKENERKRAQEIVEITSDLGPAFIKIAQAISMRPDILSPVYISELQKLQDRVPPFDDDLAADIVVQALPPGTSLSSLFKYGRAAITQPVAAASIGQVYKVELENGNLVALKVQRPDLLQMVSLDLFIVQDLLERGSKASDPQLADMCKSTNEVIGAWAARFIQELDYRQEAANQIRFAESMAKSSYLQNSLRVPKVYTDFTSQYTLMTEWIQGERLIDMNARSPEGRKTISMLLNAYLVQLLDTGFLHADPHLGNFLLSEDGKLVVLDYGLMTEISENKRYAILEYIAHLSAKDFNATLKDLIELEFIPESVDEDPKKKAIVAPLLGEVLSELQKGGGAQRINVEQVGAQIEKLGQEYPLLIPPYFGLIIRTFSSLEGFGLRSDDNYTILDECFPYMAYRLLTDDSPRIRNVLKTFLYGTSATQLKVDRVEDMLQGFRTFNDLMPQRANANERTDIDPVTRDTLRLLLAPNGNYVQELVVDELVRIIDSGSRNVLLTLLQQLHSNATEAMDGNSPLGQFQRLNPLLPLVTMFAEQNIALLKLTEEDKNSIAVAERLIQVLQPMVTAQSNVLQVPPSPATVQNAFNVLQTWSPLALDLLPGVQRMSFRGVEKLLARAVLRLTSATETNQSTSTTAM